MNAPFFDTNGTNRLAGSNFVATLYVASPGQTTPFLRVGPLQTFRDAPNDGYWEPANVALPGFPPGTAVRVQVRFWERARVPNGNFEDAEADGADIGVAEIPLLQLNADASPTPLFGLQSASLIPTLTLSRGGPLTTSDPATATGASQLRRLCTVPVGTNRWFRLTSPAAATAVLNTDQSSIDTVMTAFTGSIVDVERLTEIACNDDRAPGKTSSAITFPVGANTFYLICVAGKNGASGPVRLNYAAGVHLIVNRLTAGPGATGLELSWIDDAGAYLLEGSQEPTRPDSWSPVQVDPFYDFDRWVVHLPVTDTHSAYRLRSQR